MNRLTYLTNDYQHALYLDGHLVYVQGRDDDMFYMLEALAKAMGMSVDHNRLKDLEGSAPQSLSEAISG